MMKDRLTVTLQIDACRNDYVDRENTPFLFSLKQEGVSGSLSPTFGFEPDGAYLAGLYPDECDGGMHFWYSPETSPFKKAKFLLRCFEGFPHNFQRLLHRLSTVFVRKTTKYSRARYVPSFYRIPFKLMPFFDVAEKHLLYEDEFINGRNIFAILRNNNKPFYFHGAPTCPPGVEDVYTGLVEADHPFDFMFLHISLLDSVGHKYGPNSDEMSSALKRVDDLIKDISTFLKKKYGDFNFVIIGDHGMAEVQTTLDMRKEIEELDIKAGKDYVYFLDSTIARFWFFDEKSKQLVTSILSRIKQGRILTEVDKDRYHLNYSHNRFGDLLFLVDPENLIFPNFWNDVTPERGMHGYEPEYSGQQSILIIHSPFINEQIKIESPVDMRRIFPTLLKLTGVKAYNDHEPDSIV
ncbi:MAG: alkaline phosphatase family protein [Planctomycetota bacterium]